jgi:hypothetical protein
MTHSFILQKNTGIFDKPGFILKSQLHTELRRRLVLFHMREVPVSNIGLETGHSDVLRGFPQAL